MKKYIAILMIALASQSVMAVPVPDTIFTYQGELKNAGGVASGSFDMSFSLWDVDAGGVQIGLAIDKPGIVVTDGRFTVQLDMGANAFDNNGRWLEITVEGFTLSPRQPITRSPYSIQTRGIFVDDNNNVGIGTTSPNSDLKVVGDGSQPTVRISNGGSCANMDNTGLIIADICGSARAASFYGVTTNSVVSIANDGVGKAADFSGDVSFNGGKVGIGTSDPVEKLQIVGGTDVSPAGGGFLVLGNLTGQNIAIDSNEIMARFNGRTSNLHLNANGGNIICGGSLDINYSIVTGLSDATCPSGTQVIGGGCRIAGDAEVRASYPSSNTNWHCEAGDQVGFYVLETYAICANVK